MRRLRPCGPALLAVDGLPRAAAFGDHRGVKVGLLTREYPPDVLGGAGHHVEFLAQELRVLTELEVHCWGDGEAQGVLRHPPPAGLTGADDALRAFQVGLAMVAELAGRELVHSHTWHTALAGHLAALRHGIPHVMTYHLSGRQGGLPGGAPAAAHPLAGWAEDIAIGAADAVIAVSHRLREDLLRRRPGLDPDRVRVIHSGVDTRLYRPGSDDSVLHRLGIDRGRPYVLFAGGTEPRKGLGHLLRAARGFDPGAQLVLCVPLPAPGGSRENGDGPTGPIAGLDTLRDGVHWIPRPLPRPELIQLLGHAAVVVCPSAYEPLGNTVLEAMACGTPVVASAGGGLPEAVDDGRTGLLVPYDPDRPDAFESGLTQAVNRILDDPADAVRMGAAARHRTVRDFGWGLAARRTAELYGELLGRR
jgi:alpha-maltose-1-phosphate synthase